MSRILIAGCGDIGTALGRRLLAAGHDVWGLRRSVSALPEGIAALPMDLAEAAQLQRVPRGLDAVYYIVSPDAYDDGAYAAAFVQGLGNLLACPSLQTEPPARLFFVSSTSVYGQRDGERVDEGSPTEPATFAGRRLLQAEQLLRRSAIPGTVVRFGGIYGRGEGRLIERTRAGLPCQAAPPLYTNRIHRDDCVALLHFLLEMPEPAAIYLGVDCEPAPQCEVVDWLAAALGVDRPPRSRDANGDRGSGKRCSNGRLLAAGYRFRYPTFREGYAAVLAGPA